MKSILMCLSVLVLCGCATTPIETSENNDFIKLNESSSIQFVRSWPQKPGEYLQKVKATIQGKPFFFTVHLTLENEKITAYAYNDIYGRLYHLTWTPQKTSWESSTYIPDVLHPDYIIADVFLSYLPMNQLVVALKNATVREEKFNGDTVRIIESNGREIRRILRSQCSGDLCKKIILQNKENGYELNIETVPL